MCVLCCAIDNSVLASQFVSRIYMRPLISLLQSAYFGLFGLTDDDDPVLSEFFWGTSNTEELVPGQRALSKVMGIRNITLALIKLTILFGGGAAASTTTTSHHQEGSFLRRDLFAVIGGCQVLGACILLGDGKSQVAAKNAGASFLPTCCVIATEGLVLLYDAFFRDRPVKKH